MVDFADSVQYLVSHTRPGVAFTVHGPGMLSSADLRTRVDTILSKLHGDPEGPFPWFEAAACLPDCPEPFLRDLLSFCSPTDTVAFEAHVPVHVAPLLGLQAQTVREAALLDRPDEDGALSIADPIRRERQRAAILENGARREALAADRIAALPVHPAVVAAALGRPLPDLAELPPLDSWSRGAVRRALAGKPFTVPAAFPVSRAGALLIRRRSAIPTIAMAVEFGFLPQGALASAVRTAQALGLSFSLTSKHLALVEHDALQALSAEPGHPAPRAAKPRL